MSKKYCLDLYLEFMNDFLTEGAFADYHGMDDARAHRLLSIGRKLAHRGIVKMVEVKARVGIDTACYTTAFIKVDSRLLKDEAKLTANVIEQLTNLHSDGELDDFEPDWEMQSNFRLVSLGMESGRGGSEETLLRDVPVDRNYHDFGLEISGQLRRDADVPDWLTDLARHYKLID